MYGRHCWSCRRGVHVPPSLLQLLRPCVLELCLLWRGDPWRDALKSRRATYWIAAAVLIAVLMSGAFAGIPFWGIAICRPLPLVGDGDQRVDVHRIGGSLVEGNA